MPRRPTRRFVATAAVSVVGLAAAAGMAIAGWHYLRSHRYTPEQLAAATRRLPNVRVVVRTTAGGGFTATAAELGMAVDPTASAAARAVRYRADERAVFALVAARDGARTAPVEPVVRARKGGGAFIVIAGKPGHGIDPRVLLRALPKARARSGGRLDVTVGRGTVPPRTSTTEAARLASAAEAMAGRSLVVTAGSARATISPATIRPWVHSESGPDGLHLALDSALMQADLGRALAKATVPAAPARFTVVAGQPQVSPGTPGQRCCADATPGLVWQALSGPRHAVALPLQPVPPAAPTGLTEPVGSFTTHHAAGQPRVTNIHRIADLVKGTIVPPGGTFSLNGAVGQRTPAKGFVVDHEINEDGKFDEAVGGGISQFATTTFNAAFFAGLDFGEYQSHSIYISRYPFGREATVSWRHPDLQIKNTTPYAVGIWATYTGTSVTVTLYSTPYLASVTQSAQTTAPFGPGCTRVTTERTRKYLDGRTSVDHVFAVYQPAEGIKCS